MHSSWRNNRSCLCSLRWCTLAGTFRCWRPGCIAHTCRFWCCFGCFTSRCRVAAFGHWLCWCSCCSWCSWRRWHGCRGCRGRHGSGGDHDWMVYDGAWACWCPRCHRFDEHGARRQAPVWRTLRKLGLKDRHWWQTHWRQCTLCCWTLVRRMKVHSVWCWLPRRTNLLAWHDWSVCGPGCYWRRQRPRLCHERWRRLPINTNTSWRMYHMQSR